MMKKLFLSIAILFVASSVFAQNSAVSKAQLSLDKGDIAKAFEVIKPATSHEKSSVKAKTWLVNAKVLLAVLESQDEAVQNLMADGDKLENAILASFDKVKELDKKNGLFISEVEVSIPSVRESLKDRFSRALFNKGVSVQNNPKEAMRIFKKIASFRPDDFGVAKNAAYFAMQAEEYGEAMKLYQSIANNDKYADYIKEQMDAEADEEKKKQYNAADIYYSMIRIASMPIEELLEAREDLEDKEKIDAINAKIEAKRNEKYAIVEQGRKKYPNDQVLLNEAINHFIQTSQPDKAVDMMTQAIKLDPNNVVYYWNLGILSQDLKKEDDAVKYYEKALTIDGTCYEALYGLGAIHYNRGAKVRDGLDYKKYQDKNSAEMKEIQGHFTKAVEYMEKAYKIKNDEMQLLRPLKIIYTDLDRKADADRIEAAIKELVGG